MASKKRPISNKPVTPFEPKDYDLDLKKLVVGELLGKGNFSKVFKGLYKGNIVAIKKCVIEEGWVKYVKGELSILRRVEHPGIVGFVGAAKPPPHKEKEIVYIVTEYIQGGDLRMLLQRKGISLGWQLRVRIMAEVVEALLYLHDRDILHRDIKTENVMLTLDLKPKLIDLGFSRLMPENKHMTMCGTDEFMSPEVCFGMEYDQKADIYSYGILMAEVITKKEPGKATGFLNRIPRSGFCIETNELEKEFKKAKAPASLLELTKRVLADEPEDRPTTEQLLEELQIALKNLPKEKAAVKAIKEQEILQEINSKWERILKHGDKENSALQLDEDDFAKNFLYSKTIEKNAIKGREQSIQERRSSVRRGVKEAQETIEGKLTGYLWKKGGNFKSWKKRYMVLTSQGLIYFKTKELFEKDKENPQGALLYLDMVAPAGHPAAELVSLVTAGRRYCFRILTKSKKRFIAASSDAEAQAWVDSLNAGLFAYRENFGNVKN